MSCNKVRVGSQPNIRDKNNTLRSVPRFLAFTLEESKTTAMQCSGKTCSAARNSFSRSTCEQIKASLRALYLCRAGLLFVKLATVRLPACLAMRRLGDAM